MRVVDTKKLEQLQNFIHDYAFHHNGDAPKLS